MFGEKDYQQLRVVEQMTRDLDLPTRIIAVPTAREKDGLALSSRNLYLCAREREQAPILYRVLTECAQKLLRGEKLKAVLRAGSAGLERAGFSLDYLEARHAHTLQRVASLDEGPIRLLVAARLGKTRLIDNVPV
jgi:pantoate--beta-alanine ligase